MVSADTRDVVDALPAEKKAKKPLGGADPKSALSKNPPAIYDTMTEVDPEEAKRSIIETIKSAEDDRFPSQGVNYSDMTENDRIDQAVASEILDRTRQHEEMQYFQKLRLINMHLGTMDNQTNEIIDHVAGDMADELKITEVSDILRAHVEDMERRYNNQAVPNEPNSDEDEHTLVLGADESLEDTLTDDKVIAMEQTNDSGIGHDKSIEKEDCEKDLSDSDKNVESTCNVVTDNGHDVNATEIDNSGGDEIFEDCVDDLNTSFNDEKLKEFNKNDPKEENYSIEMKLTLGIEDKRT